jgi:hypothetical protein
MLILPANNQWKLKMHTTLFWYPPIMPNTKHLISVAMPAHLWIPETASVKGLPNTIKLE